VEKGEVKGTLSAQVIKVALNYEKEIGHTTIKSISYSGNLLTVIQTSSTNQIASLLELNGDSKSCCGVDSKW